LLDKVVFQSLRKDSVSRFSYILEGVCGSIFGYAGKKDQTYLIIIP